MSGILELLKNTKVEWKTLGEVCEISKGVQFNKRDMLKNGKYPVINGGTLPSGHINIFNSVENTITVSQGGASAGFVNFLTGKFWLGAHAFSVIPHKDIIEEYQYDYNEFNRFLFHILKLNQGYLQNSKEGAGIPSISKETLSNIKIALMDKKLQREIVRILDTFSELIAELQAELILRQKQYEYYGEYLIFNAQFKIVKLKDICTVNQGLQLPINKRYKESGKNRYRYITIQFLKEKNDKQFYIENPNSNVLCNKDDILVTRTGNTGDIITGVEGCFHNNFFKVNCNELVVKRYLYYVLKSGKVNKRLKELASKGTVPDLPHNKFYELEIPLPSIEEQKKIVTMLDKFSEIANDLEQGLPAEINLRQKQYEYYRNKLLSFPHQN